MYINICICAPYHPYVVHFIATILFVVSFLHINIFVKVRWLLTLTKYREVAIKTAAHPPTNVVVVVERRGFKTRGSSQDDEYYTHVCVCVLDMNLAQSYVLCTFLSIVCRSRYF